MLKFSGAVIWRLGTRAIIRKHSTPSATVFKTEKIDTNTTRLSEKPEDEKDKTGNKSGGGPRAAYSCQCFFTSQREIILIRRHLQAYKLPSLVAAAFASINSPDPPEGQKKPSIKSVKLSRSQQMDLQIQKAKDVEGLLLVAESPIVSRRHALKMVSVLSDWSSSNKVQLTSFEKDPRFLKLCRILARTPTSQAVASLNMAEDLSTVLGITGDDEAARLISNLSLPQMIKVMKALNQKGRRSTPLLRALAHNIVRQADPIDLKKSADLLFAMAALNFPDPLLLDRICSDVSSQLPSNSDKPAVVNSVLVSLGLLKYRHEAALSQLAQWLATHSDVVRASDVASAVVTLATVNYDPPGCDSLFEMATKLKEDDLSKSSSWLDLVFSLLILNRASEAHLSSTLRPEFIDKLLASGEIAIPARRKLMAIDAYVSTIPSYCGPRLPEDISVGVPIVYTKEKSLFVQSVMDTFKNLVSSENFLRKDCNSNMGFLYDGEFALNDKCNPVPLEKAANDKSVFRIAVLSLDYHDMCRKTPVPLGLFHLYTRLLTLKGFKVLQIPYTEYSPKDKLLTRVQYIETRLKQIVSLS